MRVGSEAGLLNHGMDISTAPLMPDVGVLLCGDLVADEEGRFAVRESFCRLR
jgi:hypothetical protein